MRDEILSSTIDLWRQRVSATVRVRDPGDVEKIACLCAEAEHFGEKYFSVWHMSAKFYGTECHCRVCCPMGAR